MGCPSFGWTLDPTSCLLPLCPCTLLRRHKLHTHRSRRHVHPVRGLEVRHPLGLSSLHGPAMRCLPRPIRCSIECGRLRLASKISLANARVGMWRAMFGPNHSPARPSFMILRQALIATRTGMPNRSETAATSAAQRRPLCLGSTRSSYATAVERVTATTPMQTYFSSDRSRTLGRMGRWSGICVAISNGRCVLPEDGCTCNVPGR
mmetsp:Transcript_3579/g.9071  ORF Transcript_3579/g.9071 Transcript_3579/m.9071 type:complete len:206 (+) Transcript_3579:373-990(+)